MVSLARGFDFIAQSMVKFLQYKALLFRVLFDSSTSPLPTIQLAQAGRRWQLDVQCESRDYLPPLGGHEWRGIEEVAGSNLQQCAALGLYDMDDSAPSCCNFEGTELMVRITRSVVDFKRRLVTDSRPFLEDADQFLLGLEGRIVHQLGLDRTHLEAVYKIMAIERSSSSNEHHSYHEEKNDPQNSSKGAAASPSDNDNPLSEISDQQMMLLQCHAASFGVMRVRLKALRASIPLLDRALDALDALCTRLYCEKCFARKDGQNNMNPLEESLAIIAGSLLQRSSTSGEAKPKDVDQTELDSANPSGQYRDMDSAIQDLVDASSGLTTVARWLRMRDLQILQTAVGPQCVPGYVVHLNEGSWLSEEDEEQPEVEDSAKRFLWSLLGVFMNNRVDHEEGTTDQDVEDSRINFLERYQVWADRWGMLLGTLVQKVMHQVETLMRVQDGTVRPDAREFFQMQPRDPVESVESRMWGETLMLSSSSTPKNGFMLAEEDDQKELAAKQRASEVYSWLYGRAGTQRAAGGSGATKMRLLVPSVIQRSNARRRFRVWLLSRLNRLGHLRPSVDPNVEFERLLRRLLKRQNGLPFCRYLVARLENFVEQHPLEISSLQVDSRTWRRRAAEGDTSPTNHDDSMWTDAEAQIKPAINADLAEVQSSFLRSDERVGRKGIGIVLRISDVNDRELVLKIAKQVAILNKAYSISGLLHVTLMEDWLRSLPRHNHYPQHVGTLSVLDETLEVVDERFPNSINTLDAVSTDSATNSTEIEEGVQTLAVSSSTASSPQKEEDGNNPGSTAIKDASSNGTHIGDMPLDSGKVTVAVGDRLRPKRESYFSSLDTLKHTPVYLREKELPPSHLLWRKHHGSLTAPEIAREYVFTELGFPVGWLCDLSARITSTETQAGGLKNRSGAGEATTTGGPEVDAGRGTSWSDSDHSWALEKPVEDADLVRDERATLLRKLRGIAEYLRDQAGSPPLEDSVEWSMPEGCQRLGAPPSQQHSELLEAATASDAGAADEFSKASVQLARRWGVESDVLGKEVGEFASLDGDLREELLRTEQARRGGAAGAALVTGLGGLLDELHGDEVEDATHMNINGESKRPIGTTAEDGKRTTANLMHAVEMTAPFQDDFRKPMSIGVDKNDIVATSQFEEALFALWRSRFSNVGVPASSRGDIEMNDLRKSRKTKKKKLIYTCHPHNLCGGHGDRANGMLNAFVLALLLDRDLYLDADNPVPLSMLFHPNHVDWRVAHTAIVVANNGEGMEKNAEIFHNLDRRYHHEVDDLFWNNPAETILLATNLREVGQFWARPPYEQKARQLGLLGTKFLARYIWRFLFQDSFFLDMQVRKATERLQLGLFYHERSSTASTMEGGEDIIVPRQGEGIGDEESKINDIQNGSAQEEDPEQAEQEEASTSEVLTFQPFIGIHFRAGNESAWWDPKRHSLDMLDAFLDCARVVEQEVFGSLAPLFGSDRLTQHANKRQDNVTSSSEIGVPFFLSADTAKIFDVPSVAHLIAQGKLKVLDTQDDRDAVAHVDRSKGHRRLNGIVPSYVSFRLLSQASAVVLSRSWFGDVAAEIGWSGQNAYFAGDGSCVRMDLSTS